MTCDVCYGPSNTGSLCALCFEDLEGEERAREARVAKQIEDYERELEERRAA
jgi:hypothetical protein